MRSVSRNRIRVISVAFILFAFLLVFRLYILQIVQHQAFNDKADRQYSNPTGRVFDRGNIFFETRDGTRISAATLKSGYTLAVNPTLITNLEKTYDTLNAILPLEKDQFMDRAGKKSDPYEEIANQLTESQAKQIETAKLPGVRLFKEQWRYYPTGNLASQVIGFLGYNGQNQYGAQYGLEKEYDHVLSRDSENLYSNFFAEIFSHINKAIKYEAEGQGDIVTTIEPNVQMFFEKELAGVNKKYSSKLTGGVIINPKTGAIYAMGLYPSFDPNFFRIEKDGSVFTNQLVQSVYEMGSIIKPLTMAAGLDAGVVTPTTTYFDPGNMTFNNKTIYNYDLRGRGVVSMQEVLNQSLNTGVATVATKLGNARFRTYLYSLGLGEQTGIDLPNEVSGLVDNLKSNRDIEFVTASFGQGIAISPIETVRALATLGNGGYMITPHIVKKIEYSSGLWKDIEPGLGEQVFSKQTSETISKMLTQVVDKALLEGKVRQEHYSIAAKTGTAQIARPGGGYYDDRFLHSFFGYFPANDPEFLVFMYTVEPHGEEYASHTLTLPFQDIIKFLINYYDVPPDR